MSDPRPQRPTPVITDLLEVPSMAVSSRLRLTAVRGPGAGSSLDLIAGSYIVGKGPESDLVLDDPSVSRRHLLIEVLEGSKLRLEDLGSTNGSFLFDARFTSVVMAPGAAFRVGRTELTVSVIGAAPGANKAVRSGYGDLVGSSLAMRKLYDLLERVAASDAPVLLQGETGTGKEVCAEAIHAHSARRGHPLVIVDLAALPPSLIESELFGHARGSFTGAHADRVGAFECADGGTLFLDEVGELSLELQPRLLRAIERGQVKRVGSNDYRSVHVRVVAATHRDLLAMSREGRFREDLYHRLAVLSVRLPSLRQRPEDIPLLVEHILARLGSPGAVGPQTLALLQRHDWPGNVRELRNVLERAISLSPGSAEIPPELLALPGDVPEAPVATAQPFKEAKDRLIEAFERDYLEKLLARCNGNVSRAAREAGIDRVYLHRLLRRYLPGKAERG